MPFNLRRKYFTFRRHRAPQAKTSHFHECKLLIYYFKIQCKSNPIPCLFTVFLYIQLIREWLSEK